MVDVIAPNGLLELMIDDTTKHIEITAQGFLSWSTGLYIYLEGRESFDLGLVELESAQTVRGRVTDGSTGQPIEGAQLRGLRIQERVLSSWDFNNVVDRTDSYGEFEVTGLPSAGGLLSVSAQGYQRTRVTVDEVETYLEIELTTRTGSISGRVVSLDGEPVHPAFVDMGSRGRRTAEDGTFDFVVVGSYRIIAAAESGWSKPLEGSVENGEHVTGIELVISEIGRVHGTVLGLLEGETASVTVARKGGRVESDGSYKVTGVQAGEHEARCVTSTGRELRSTVELDENQDARLDFVFEGRSKLTGRVMAASVPVPSLEIQVNPLDRQHARSQTTTRGDGSFVIDGLDEGDYTVYVKSRGTARRVAVSGDTRVDIDLGSNELTGRVAAAGTVLGVSVYLEGLGKGEGIHQHTTVDADGFYRFSGIPSGSYELTVMHDQYKETTRSVEVKKSVHDFDIFLQPNERDQAKEDLELIELMGL